MTKDRRLYARFDIGMDEHPKIMLLSDAAFRALIESTFYARRQMTDGFLREQVVLRKWGAAVADELSSNDSERPSWVRVAEGWRIHDFSEHQTTRADIEAKREAGRRGGLQKATNRVAPATEVLEQKGSNTLAKTETETDTKTASPPKARETVLSVDWAPTADHIKRAKELGVDVLNEAETFRLHADAHERRAVNWNAAFTMWLKKAKPRRPNTDWALR